jgi:hypothetical protein
MDTQILRESTTDAIRYWEPRRLAYIAVLAAIVLIHLGLRYPAFNAVVSTDRALHLFVLAVLANVAYCAAYAADMFAQASAYRDRWRNYRWVLFTIGTSFAGVLTHFLTLGMMGSRVK